MSLNRQMNKLLKNRPVYKVDPGYATNAALAANAAFGRDRGVMNQEASIQNSAADAVAQAADVSNSSAGILATLANVNASGNTAYNNLAAVEAQTQAAGRQALTGANAAMAEENDKAWNYNTNEPYQSKIANLRERKKARQELLMKGIDTAAALMISANESASKLATGGMA